MRIFSAAFLVMVALAGCARRAAPGDAAPVQASDDRIECRTAGESGFSRSCTVERTTSGDAVVLTLRHADGHFRRLSVGADGRGAASADGAEPVSTHAAPDHAIEIAVAGDRYRLPAVAAPGGPATAK